MLFSQYNDITKEANNVRCPDATCCENWRSEELKTFLKKYAYKLRAPVFSKQQLYHYDTFLQRTQIDDKLNGYAN